ncbi:helix-turn-helix transcriptional regulator [Ferrovibrio terrae]|uniref:helix-turn-helix domain-containing protein n=1 Tax=Ferrovibrio terrae TaxID=2594003 RepID=UPI00313782E1
MNRGALAMLDWRKRQPKNPKMDTGPVGISQDEAARRAQISQTAWGRYELAQRLPTACALGQLKRACGIDPNLFLDEISVASIAAAVAGSQPVISSLRETPAGVSTSGAPAAFSEGGHD